MKRYKLKQRFPNFFSGFTPEEVEFDSIEELHQVDFVKRWMSNSNFSHLKIVRKESKQQILMCYMNDKTFWAIGWLTNAEDLEL